MEFTTPKEFDPRGFAEALREDHGYLGPDDTVFYPTLERVEDGINIEARTSEGNQIDERSRESIQTIIDNHQPPEPVQVKSIEQLILETNSFGELKQAIQAQRDRPPPPVGV